jgi:hypothetical protein
MRQQLVQQLEALLYLAYKLQMEKLQQVLRRFISCNNGWQFGSLLCAGRQRSALRSIVSARVLDAAASCGAAQDALISHISTETVTLSGAVPQPPGVRQVFERLLPRTPQPAAQQLGQAVAQLFGGSAVAQLLAPLAAPQRPTVSTFRARVVESIYCFVPGQVVTVELDPEEQMLLVRPEEGGGATVPSVQIPLNLVLGHQLDF